MTLLPANTIEMETRYHVPTILTIVSDRSENSTHLLESYYNYSIRCLIYIHGTSNSLPHHYCNCIGVEIVTCRLIFCSSLQVALLFTLVSFSGWIAFVKGFSDAINRYFVQIHNNCCNYYDVFKVISTYIVLMYSIV